MVEAGSQAKTKIKLMTHEFKHPKYYTELRKRNKTGVTATTKRDIGHSQELSFGFPPPVNSDQAISLKAHDGECERSPDSGLKQEDSSDKQQAGEAQASSYKRSSHK